MADESNGREEKNGKGGGASRGRLFKSTIALGVNLRWRVELHNSGQ